MGVSAMILAVLHIAFGMSLAAALGTSGRAARIGAAGMAVALVGIETTWMPSPRGPYGEAASQIAESISMGIARRMGP